MGIQSFSREETINDCIRSVAKNVLRKSVTHRIGVVF